MVDNLSWNGGGGNSNVVEFLDLFKEQTIFIVNLYCEETENPSLTHGGYIIQQQ